jgi:hypothetical protein
MSSPNQVRDLLRGSSELTQIIPSENMKSFNLPKEMQDNAECLLVTDVRAPFTNFGGNHAQGRYRTVQIQAWFSPDHDVIDEFQKQMNQVLEDNQWFNSYDGGIDEDPDTSELFFTMQYSKQELGV